MASSNSPARKSRPANAVADGGRLMVPHLTRRIVDSEGRTVQTVSPRVQSVVMKPSTAQSVGKMMQGVVEHGTGIAVAAVGKPLAGKTGTTSDFNDAWFVGFSPGLVAGAYVGFAVEHPALYDAMFTLHTELPFGRPEGPRELHAGFAELRGAVTPLAGGRDPETLTEVVWSALHGIATLTRAHRLRPDSQQARLEMLVGQLAGGSG